MSDPQLTYLYNCGILISCGGESILVDGVFGEENNFFDTMPEEYEKALFCGAYPFENIRALLFTHCHGDHYSRKQVEKYTDVFPGTEVISPETVLMGEAGSVTTGNFAISYFQTGHIPTGKEEGSHYVFKICAGGKRIVITGDMDPDKLGMIIENCGADADLFFINPAMLLYEMKHAGDTLLRSVKNLYVYHLPSEARDDYGYRSMTCSSLGRIRRHLGDITLLLDNMRDVE